MFFEEGDSKDFMIQLDKDVVHHIISKEYGYCELSKEAFLSCKSRYSQQIYLMLASWRNEGEHRIPLKELESQLNQEGNSLESRYSQQIYLMLASWRNEGEHRIPLKELEAQMNQDSNSLELSRTSTKKAQPAPTIQNILNDVKSELDAHKSDLSFTYEEGGGEVTFKILV